MNAFQIVVLGCSGGPIETNVSGYLVSPLEEQQWIALDAGTLLGGIEKALEKKSLAEVAFTESKLTKAAEMLTKHIRSYVLSHAHLDHIAALVLNSQIDKNKSILGINPTIDNLRDHIFNGKIWPNYGSEGKEPLGRYSYVRLELHVPKNIPNTAMTIEAYQLSHPHNYPSTAFLIEYSGHYLLYVGDTSSDFLEKEKRLSQIWRRIGPLLKEKKLHGIFLECSFPEEDADQVIYGHLDTKLMIKELESLSQIAQVSLEGFPVIVTHRKDSLKSGTDSKELIKKELLAHNTPKVNFIFPSQGERYLI